MRALSIFTLMYILPLIGKADSLNCIELEGIKIGCVSSIDHSCKRNVMIDKEATPCRYGSDFSTMYRVEGPIAWQCKSTENTTTCPSNCTNPDGCGGCVTTSTCVEYFPPSCQETCIGCWNQIVTANIGRTRGCIICTRERCPDEPEAGKACPGMYNGMQRIDMAAKCSAASSCPTTAVDPLGNSHTVNVTRTSCEGIEPPDPPPDGTLPGHCPWLVDERTAGNCEEIRPGNRNPPGEN